MNSTDLVIVQLDRARTAMVEAKTIQDKKKLVDMSAAAKTFARRQGVSGEIQSAVNSFHIETLRLLGKALKEAPDAKRGPKTELGADEELNYGPSLHDLGIDKKTSSLVQKIAALPAEQFEAVKAGTLAMTAALREVRHASKVAPPPRSIGADRAADPRGAGSWRDTNARTAKENFR